MQPLAGITVLDLTHMLSGPYGTMTLTDLGARTIKVEPPGKGEGTRELLAGHPDYSRDGMGAYFMTLNRSKESVCIDLKSDAGRAVFYDLVRHADVVFDNFGAGVPQRLKIDHATLAAINPRIITCSVTGFGETGPDTQRPAFDQVVQGMGGGMSITGTARRRAGARRHPDRRPRRRHLRRDGRARRAAGAPRHRRRPARRRLDARRPDLAPHLHGDDAPDVGPRARAGSATRTSSMCRTTRSATGDGHVIIACIGDAFYERFLKVVPHPELLQARVPEAAGALRRAREDRRDHQRGARQEHLGLLARQAARGAHSVRPGQRLRAGAQRPADRRARHGRRGAAAGRNERADARHPDEVLGRADAGVQRRRRRSAATPARCSPSCSATTRRRSTRCAKAARSSSRARGARSRDRAERHATQSSQATAFSGSRPSAPARRARPRGIRRRRARCANARRAPARPAGSRRARRRT